MPTREIGKATDLVSTTFKLQPSSESYFQAIFKLLCEISNVTPNISSGNARTKGW
jgi:hypothetical protein